MFRDPNKWCNKPWLGRLMWHFFCLYLRQHTWPRAALYVCRCSTSEEAPLRWRWTRRVVYSSETHFWLGGARSGQTCLAMMLWTRCQLLCETIAALVRLLAHVYVWKAGRKMYNKHTYKLHSLFSCPTSVWFITSSCCHIHIPFPRLFTNGF